MANIETAQTNWHNFLGQGGAPTTPAATTANLYFYDGDGFWAIDSSGLEHPIAVFMQDIFIPATDMYPSLTAGCAALTQSESATNKQNIKTLDFDQTTQEHAEFSISMPNSWNNGTLIFQPFWTAAAGVPAQTVKWALQARSYAYGDLIDQAWGTAIVVTDTLNATGGVQFAASAALTVGGSPSTNELLLFRVYRDISDTLAADAKLLGIKLYWTR